MATTPKQATVQGKAAASPNQPQATAVAKRPPPFQIKPMASRQHHLKLLIYGNYGTGKTHLAGTASEVTQLQDVLLINAEAGDLTLENFENIDEVTVQDFKTLARVFEFLKAHCVARDAQDDEKLAELQERVFGQGPSKDVPLRKYNTVILDSLSEIEQYSFNQLLGVLDTTKLDEEVMSAEFKEYKQNHGMILRLVRNFRNLPMHVIFTCAETYTQDETKKMRFTLDLTGKLSKKVQGFMDMVGYLVVGQAQDENSEAPRRLYVSPSGTGRYDAKHRYAGFRKPYFDNPTIGLILKETGLLSKEGARIK